MPLPPTLLVVLRFLWYVFSRILIWAFAAALVVLAFYAAMDYMNAEVLVKDGLQLRAEVIIKGDDPTALTKVFSKSFLEQDAQLSSSAYRAYSITGVDYGADVGFCLILPWNNSIVLRVTEKISRIEGTAVSSAEGSSAAGETPPPWQNAVYDVKLIRYEGNWRIVSMELVEELPMPTPSPSPPPTPSPSRTATPAPSVSADGSAEPEPTDEVIED
jgi:hypothetical protein